MNPQDLLKEVQDIIASGDIEKGKQFIEEHKDEFGPLLEQAQALLSGNANIQDVVEDVAGENAGGILDKVKGIFGK